MSESAVTPTPKESGESLKEQLQPIPRTEGQELAGADGSAYNLRALVDAMLKFLVLDRVYMGLTFILNVIVSGITLSWLNTGEQSQGSRRAFIVIEILIVLISLYRLKVLLSGKPGKDKLEGGGKRVRWNMTAVTENRASEKSTT